MLPQSLSLLRKFGRQRLSGRDFVNLGEQNDVDIVISSEPRRGFYYCTNRKHNIVLSSRLRAEERSIVGWHEFAHFLQNFYARKTIAAFSGNECDRDSPSEKLADIFASIALRPDLIKVTGPMDFIKMILHSDGGR